VEGSEIVLTAKGDQSDSAQDGESSFQLSAGSPISSRTAPDDTALSGRRLGEPKGTSRP
jgi:hypothetical protein